MFLEIIVYKHDIYIYIYIYIYLGLRNKIWTWTNWIGRIKATPGDSWQFELASGWLNAAGA